MDDTDVIWVELQLLAQNSRHHGLMALAGGGRAHDARDVALGIDTDFTALHEGGDLRRGVHQIFKDIVAAPRFQHRGDADTGQAAL